MYGKLSKRMTFLREWKTDLVVPEASESTVELPLPHPLLLCERASW
jgi:hypothetical protein